MAARRSFNTSRSHRAVLPYAGLLGPRRSELALKLLKQFVFFLLLVDDLVRIGNPIVIFVDQLPIRRIEIRGNVTVGSLLQNCCIFTFKGCDSRSEGIY